MNILDVLYQVHQMDAEVKVTTEQYSYTLDDGILILKV